MQRQFEGDRPGVPFQFLGVNEVGQESGNAATCQGRSIPWLQETQEERAWGPWEVEYRDVVFLDARNHRVAVFNLTVHDLSREAEYDSLYRLVKRLTGREKGDD